MAIRRGDVDAGLVDFSDVASGQLLPPVHPGDVLRDEFLVPMELDVNRLAQEIEVTRLDDIMHGRCAVTAETASLLGRRFNMNPSFWMNLQARYDRDVASAFDVATLSWKAWPTLREANCSIRGSSRIAITTRRKNPPISAVANWSTIWRCGADTPDTC